MVTARWGASLHDIKNSEKDEMYEVEHCKDLNALRREMGGLFSQMNVDLLFGFVLRN